jgi:hypothetical protein
VAADGGGCRPFFDDGLVVDGRDFRVYRCDWGWCVKRGELAGRSRFLDEAFEHVLGRTLDREALRSLIDMLDRELTAERDRRGATASRSFQI